MKSFLLRVLTGIAVTIAFTAPSFAQLDVELAKVAKIGVVAAKGYITPLASGFGNGLNTAFYHSADLHDILGFDVGVKVGVGLIPEAEKTYTLDMPSAITMTYGTTNVTFLRGTHYKAQYTAQSAAGDKDKETAITTLIQNGPVPPNYELLKLPAGAGLPIAGAFAPQLAVGLPFGIEVFARIMPQIEFDAGKFSMNGFGLRYDVDQWLPLFPVDIAVHFATQKLTLKNTKDAEIISAKATAYGVEVSKRLFILTLYGGFQLESSSVHVGDIEYKGFQNQTLTLKGFDVEGSNKSRFTVGARLILLILNVHVEYSLAKTPMLGAGVGISLR